LSALTGSRFSKAARPVTSSRGNGSLPTSMGWTSYVFTEPAN
jgi:hypothetical protein